MLLNGIRGFCMAMANSIPGVSGETIAFLLGFYGEFINSFNDLMGKDNARRKQVFIFLFKLGTGWILDFYLSALVLSDLFQDHIYEISFIFMGLTLFAIPTVIREERRSIKGRYGNLIFASVGMALVFCIPYFSPVGGQGINVSMEHLSLGLAVYAFITATVAITTTVFLGISGSTLLLIFGVYAPIIGAIEEFLHVNLSYVPALAVFGLGIITSIVGIIELIKLCLKRYHSWAIYTIIDLMIDSLYAITMGSTTLGVSRDPMGLDMFRILSFLLGGLILAGPEFMETRPEKQ